jgi:hypothetical protein
MKITLVPALSFLAVLAAFAVLPVSLPGVIAVLAVVGLVWIMSLDYAVRPLLRPTEAGIVRFAAPMAASETFHQAA